MIIKISWRNIWRNRRRTIITLSSIAFGLLLAGFFTSLSDGSYGRMIDIAASTGAGHVTIEPIDYRDHPGADKVISKSTELAGKIVSVKGVKASRIRITGQGMAASAIESTGAGFVAVEPEKETKETLFILNHIKQGKGLSSQGPFALIGADMAKQLNLKPGKKFVLTTTDKHGQVVTILLKTAGIFSTGMSEVDKNLVIVSIGYMRDQLGYDAEDASQISIFINKRWNAKSMAEKLDPVARPYGGTALPWQILLPDLDGFMSMDMTSSFIFQGFIFLVIAAGILNTILMGVTERMREFGIMMSMGMSPGRIVLMILAETFWLAVVGIIAGLMILAPVYWYCHVYGIDLAIFMAGTDSTVGGVIFEPFIKAELVGNHIRNILAAVFVLIMATGLYPAILAARANPVETIKTL